jgi:CheY-like chemotaxis protein
LAVVQGVVRAHDGAISVVSAPGQGATIRVFFPCWARPEKQEDLAKAPALPEDVTQATGTVLVVEDEDRLRFPVAKKLRKEQFAVLEAADGSAAIDLLRAHRHEVDLILLDLTIPGASSKEIVEAARLIRPGIKIVVTSAYSRQVVERTIDMAEVAGFIRKPFQLAELVQLIRYTLGSRGLRSNPAV